MMITLQNWQAHLDTVNDVQSLESLKQALIGKTGLLTQEMKNLSALSVDEKKSKGQELNLIRDAINTALNNKKAFFEEEALNQKMNAQALDLTLPARSHKQGSLHLLTQVIQDVQSYFAKLGFEPTFAPDLDQESNNFDVLNIPSFHPARQSQDTFYLPCDDPHDRLLMRTHTSNAQIRIMKDKKIPIRSLTVGRCYRNDAIDATHVPMFHQMELFALDQDITMAQLKTTLIDFLRYIFDVKDLEVRFRPSFFPFTTPSAEVDIKMKGRGWLEILGCGLIHPNVLKNGGIDADQYQGFAAGMGIERLTMLKYGLKDIRFLYDNDQRFLDAFGSSR
ncbi:MAG: Phenylalanine--tRNA ligase alpha subunit [Holosporales bacterium]